MKMMLQGEDRQVAQTLLDNITIKPDIQKTPKLILDTI